LLFGFGQCGAAMSGLKQAPRSGTSHFTLENQRVATISDMAWRLLYGQAKASG